MRAVGGGCILSICLDVVKCGMTAHRASTVGDGAQKNSVAFFQVWIELCNSMTFATRPLCNLRNSRVFKELYVKNACAFVPFDLIVVFKGLRNGYEMGTKSIQSDSELGTKC